MGPRESRSTVMSTIDDGYATSERRIQKEINRLRVFLMQRRLSDCMSVA